MSKLYIRGIAHTSEAEAVNELGADLAGFVISSEPGRFKRGITVSKAESLRAVLKRSIKTVGIFKDEPIEFIESLCEADVIDVIELRGAEDDDYILELSRITRHPIIKAARITTAEEAQAADALHCQYLLLKSATEPELLSQLQTPVFLKLKDGEKLPEDVNPYGTAMLPAETEK